jgi:hypothetical protein
MLIARATVTAALAAALVAGVSADITHADTHADTQVAAVQLAAFSSGPGDDLKDIGKCAYQAAGAKVVKQASKSVWGKLKKRKIPNLKDIGGTAASAALAAATDSNPYVAGAVIVGCSIWSAEPAG